MNNTIPGYTFVGNTNDCEKHRETFAKKSYDIKYEQPAYDINGEQLPQDYYAIYINNYSRSGYNNYMEQRTRNIRRGVTTK